MRYPNERYEVEPRRSMGRCLLIALVILVWLAVAGVLGIRFIGQRLIADAVQRRVAQPVPQGEQPRIETIPLPSVEQGRARSGPTHPIVVTDADANAWLADHGNQIQGIDNLTVHFTPGEATADVTVHGIHGRARSDVAVINGRVSAVNPRLDAPLNVLLDITPLVRLVEDRLNADLAANDVQVTDVQVQQGQLTMTVQ